MGVGSFFLFYTMVYFVITNGLSMQFINFLFSDYFPNRYLFVSDGHRHEGKAESTLPPNKNVKKRRGKNGKFFNLEFF